SENPGTTSPAGAAPRPPAASAPVAPPTVPTARPAASPSAPVDIGEIPPTDPNKPAIARSGRYMGFAERFNRYYTDPAWKPSRTVYVSPGGNGNGASREAPMSVRSAVEAARPGTRINFLPGKYQGCFELTKQNSGTYDDPIVLYPQRNADKPLGVSMTCCNSGRQACFNSEGADHVAVDGFELIGARYGV